MANLTTVPPDLVHKVAHLSFSWYDYILFSVMLTLSTLIGIYFGCFGTKQSSTDEYLMGNKKMKVVPIAVSLVASHISGITLLAVPADIYRYGSTYWAFAFCTPFVYFGTVSLFLPVFYNLRITSTYEYLERRFDSTNRIFASFLFTLGLFLYLPIVIYIPALAFSAATGINIHFITPVVCGVCIFYTTLGGLKAVVWTDTLQFTITVGAIITVTTIGINAAGGFGNVWATALDGHRLDVFDFDPDPTKRDSFWIVVIGIGFSWLSMAGIHQSCVQKFLSVPTYKDAKIAVFLFMIGILVVSSSSVIIGLIMYARYAKCDPFTTGAVEKNDQLLPYYIMDVASHVPGLPGLFIAGIFCAALSTLSASLNCLAGTVFEDFILKLTGPVFNEKTSAFILKIIVVVTGVACTALVFIIEKLGGILPLALSLGGITNGPLLGMFLMGVLFPKATSKGSFYGALISLLVLGCVAVMSQLYKMQGLVPDTPKPISVEGCLLANSTEYLRNYFNSFANEAALTNFTNIGDVFTSSLPQTEDTKPFFLFRISSYYNYPLGTILTLIFGLPISYLLGNDDPPVNKELLSPLIYPLLSDKKKVVAPNQDYYKLDKSLHLVTVDLEDDQIKA